LILLDRQGRLDWFRAPVSQVLSPVVQIFNRADSGVRAIGSGNQSDLETQLEALREERDELLADNARLRVLEEEVEQLRNQLDFQEQHPDLEPIPANVISGDPKGIERIIIIDQGREAGIRTGMAVVSPDFFVGQV